MKIGIIIQARSSSSRLPEKVLKELPFNSGITVLEQVIRRVKKVNNVTTIIVATTTEKEDQRIVEIADKENVIWYRGSKENVLERYYYAAKDNNLDIVIRITSDCPCIDPGLVELCIGEHIKNKADYTSNSITRSFPHGMDVEVFNFSALEQAYLHATHTYEKEHVTYYIYSNAKAFKIHSVNASSEFLAPEIRVTMDTKEDYLLLCAVYDYLYKNNSSFSVSDIISLFKEKPWLKMINNMILQKRVFDNEKEEILEGIKVLELQELYKAKAILENFI
ncbi:MAG: glycosyltransferase family protein [Cytophagaceae bacterium]|nr:glycosyltransferase family protein [Cytophagaceae bacterium]